MKLKQLDKAIEEAQEFINRAKILREKENPVGDYYWGSRLTASVRRQSMELTRSLSDLRNNKD